jgi:hypothetical protein
VIMPLQIISSLPSFYNIKVFSGYLRKQDFEISKSCFLRY